MPTVTIKTSDQNDIDFLADAGAAATRTGVEGAALESTPTTFVTANTVKLLANQYTQGNIFARNDGSNDDSMGLNIRIADGATILAAANSGGTYQQLEASQVYPSGSTTLDNVEVIFSYVNQTATKANWDAAVIEFEQTYSSSMANDDGYYDMAYFSTSFGAWQIEVEYDASVSTLTAPTETPGITTATVGCTTDVNSGTFYAYISTSATAPSITDLKAGTGAVWSGNNTVTNLSPSITTPIYSLNPSTTYYTYMIHNTTGGDSNLLESGSWSTLTGARTVTCSSENLRVTAPDAVIAILFGPLTYDFSAASSGDILIACTLTDKSITTVNNLTAVEAGWTLRVQTFEFYGKVGVWTKTADGTETDEGWWYAGEPNAFIQGYIVPSNYLSTGVIRSVTIAKGNTNTTSAGVSWPIRINDATAGGTVGGIYDAYSTIVTIYNILDTADKTVPTGFLEGQDTYLGGGGLPPFTANFSRLQSYGFITGAWPRTESWTLKSSGSGVNIYGANAVSTSSDNYRFYNGLRVGNENDNRHYNGTSWTTDSDTLSTGSSETGTGTPSSCLRMRQLSSSVGTDEWDDTSWATVGNRNVAQGSHAAAIGTATDTLIAGGFDAKTNFESYNGTSWTAETSPSNNYWEAAGAGSTSSFLVSGGEPDGPTLGVSDLVDEWNGTSWASGTAMLLKTMRHGTGGSSSDLLSVGGGVAGFGAGTYQVRGTPYCFLFDGTSWSSYSRFPSHTNKSGVSSGSGTSNTVSQYGGDDSTNGSNNDHYAIATSLTVRYPPEPTVWSTADSWDHGSAQLVFESPAEIGPQPAQLVLTTTAATVAKIPDTILEPGFATLTSSTRKARVRQKKYKIVERTVKPRWTRQNAVGWAPVIDVDTPSSDRFVTSTPAGLTLTENTASVSRVIAALTEALTLTTTTATVTTNAPRDVVCTTEALTLTATTATIDATIDRTVSCAAEVLTLTANTATVDISRAVSCTPEALTLTANTATVTASREVSGATAALALTANTAGVTRTRDVAATTEALALTAIAAIIVRGENRTIASTAAPLTLTENTATVQIDREVTASAEALLLSAQQGVITRSKDVAATTEALALGTNTAQIQLDRSIAGATEALLLTENAAAIDFSQIVTSATEALTLTTTPADIDQGRDAIGVTEALLLTTSAATIVADKTVTATTEALTLTANTAGVSTPREVTAQAEALTLTENPATVDAGRSVATTTEALTLTSTTATATLDKSVTGVTEALLLTENTATVAQGRLVTGTTEVLTLTTTTAGVQTDRVVSGATEALVLQAVGAQIGRGSDRDVNAQSEVLTLTEITATVQTDREVAGATEVLLLTESPATVVRGVSLTVTCTTEGLALTTLPAVVETDRLSAGSPVALALTTTQATITTGTDRTVACATEALALTASTGTATLDKPVTSVTEALTLTTNPATIGRGADLDVVCTTEALTLTEVQADVGQGRGVTGVTQALLLTTTQATITTRDDKNVICAAEVLVLTAPAAAVTKSIDLIVVCSTEALQLTPTQATILYDGGPVEAITEALVLTALPAQVLKVTVISTLPWYGREDVEVLNNAPGAPVLLVSDEEVVSLTSASVVDVGEGSGLL